MDKLCDTVNEQTRVGITLLQDPLLITTQSLLQFDHEAPLP